MAHRILTMRLGFDDMTGGAEVDAPTCRAPCDKKRIASSGDTGFWRRRTSCLMRGMTLSKPFRLASCMAPNADAMCRQLAAYLESRLETAVDLVDCVPWQERERRFDAGEIDLCWICGWPYVDKVDAGLPISAAVAPVMRAKRYAGAPIYFSDVLVSSDSACERFEDLQGQRWAFNEPRSHSGFNVVRQHLARRGHTPDYFGAMVQAGSHQSALRMVLSGEVAGAAIDSTVFEAEARHDPALLEKVRVIATLGPSPAPPWVFSTGVRHEVRTKVTRCLADMHRTPRGAAVLASWGIAELYAVSDAFYDSIRRMTPAFDQEEALC